MKSEIENSVHLRKNQKLLNTVDVYIDSIKLLLDVYKGKEYNINSLIIDELKKIRNKLNNLSEEFKKNHNNIPFDKIVKHCNNYITKSVFNKKEIFELLSLLINYKSKIKKLSHLYFKNNEPKWSNDYKYPITTKKSVFPLKK